MQAILQQFGRLVCALKGHLRGKLHDVTLGFKCYRCPRCGSTWTRKVSKTAKRAAQ